MNNVDSSAGDRTPSRKPKRVSRSKKLEVRLSPQESAITRGKFGRAAAAVARQFLLGYRVTNPTPPDRAEMLEVARAIFWHRLAVLELRRLVQTTFGADAAKLLQTENETFNHLTTIWLSNFFRTQANTPNRAD